MSIKIGLFRQTIVKASKAIIKICVKKLYKHNYYIKIIGKFLKFKIGLR